MKSFDLAQHTTTSCNHVPVERFTQEPQHITCLLQLTNNLLKPGGIQQVATTNGQMHRAGQALPGGNAGRQCQPTAELRFLREYI
jgi:hypothetical protein